MNKFTRFLKQPYPLFEKPWLLVTIMALSLIFILSVFQPFNFNMGSIAHLWVLIAFVVITIMGTSIVFVFFPKFFPKFYNPDRWTVGKNIFHYLFFLFFLSVLVAIMDLIILPVLTGKEPISFFYYPFFINIFATFTVCIIPIILITFLTKNKELKNNLQEAIRLNKILSERDKSTSSQEDCIQLYGNTREFVKAKPEDIRYIEVSGNYVDVYFLQEQKITHKLLRATIKQIEEQLQTYSMFVRCHRAFIVNINQVSNVVGNTQGYKLELFDIPYEIPVSRRYTKQFKEAIG